MGEILLVQILGSEFDTIHTLSSMVETLGAENRKCRFKNVDFRLFFKPV